MSASQARFATLFPLRDKPLMTLDEFKSFDSKRREESLKALCSRILRDDEKMLTRLIAFQDKVQTHSGKYDYRIDIDHEHQRGLNCPNKMTVILTKMKSILMFVCEQCNSGEQRAQVFAKKIMNEDYDSEDSIGKFRKACAHIEYLNSAADSILQEERILELADSLTSDTIADTFFEKALLIYIELCLNCAHIFLIEHEAMGEHHEDIEQALIYLKMRFGNDPPKQRGVQKVQKRYQLLKDEHAYSMKILRGVALHTESLLKKVSLGKPIFQGERKDLWGRRYEGMFAQDLEEFRDRVMRTNQLKKEIGELDEKRKEDLLDQVYNQFTPEMRAAFGQFFGK